MTSINRQLFLNSYSWTWQWWRIYICKTVFPTAVYSGQLELLLALKVVIYSSLFTCQYLIEESIHLLSPWQLKNSLCQTICFRPPLVEIYLLSFSTAYVSMRQTVIIEYLSYFHILYLMENWGCKQVYWDTNSFLSHHLKLVRKCLAHVRETSIIHHVF